jgi:hypothetical protein
MPVFTWKEWVIVFLIGFIMKWIGACLTFGSIALSSAAKSGDAVLTLWPEV